MIWESDLLKHELDENEIKNKILKENIDLNLIKKNNQYYYDIIKQVNREFEDENDMNHPNNILNEDTIDKISKEIISQNEEFKELRNRINMIENEFNIIINNDI